MDGERKDVWASGDAYEPYVGRWSRLVAREFVPWLRVPSNSEWLDIGCGTGALCQVVLDSASPRHVTGIDPSDGFVSFARHKVTDPRATFQVGDAQKLPVVDGSFDATVAGLVINFIPDQAKAVSEMKRATRPGRHGCSIRLGLRWRDADDASLLGCSSCFGCKSLSPRRGSALSRMSPRAFGKPFSGCRARWCGSPTNRCSDDI